MKIYFKFRFYPKMEIYCFRNNEKEICTPNNNFELLINN